MDAQELETGTVSIPLLNVAHEENHGCVTCTNTCTGNGTKRSRLISGCISTPSPTSSLAQRVLSGQSVRPTKLEERIKEKNKMFSDTVPLKCKLTLATRCSRELSIEDRVEDQDSIHSKLNSILDPREIHRTETPLLFIRGRDSSFE